MRLWRVAAALALVAVVGTAACSDDDGSSNAADDTTTRATDVSTTVPPTTVPTTQPTTDVTVGIICTTPADAASSLVSAWSVDDRSAALRCASDTVVNRLFQTSGAGNTWMDQGCDTTDPAAPVCAYSYEGGAAFLTTTGSDTDGWKVSGLRYVAD